MAVVAHLAPMIGDDEMKPEPTERERRILMTAIYSLTHGDASVTVSLKQIESEIARLGLDAMNDDELRFTMRRIGTEGKRYRTARGIP